MALSYDEIAEILKIIDGSSCDELVVDTGDMKLVVRRNSAGGAHVQHDDRPVVAPLPTAPVAPPPAAQSRNRRSAGADIPDKASVKIAATTLAQVEVAAPMVGTFYRAPAPDAPPFVDVGAAVRKGQPLCLIEVMKLFTTIASEHDGRIVAIGAENGELVEYGRTLFVIDPA